MSLSKDRLARLEKMGAKITRAPEIEKPSQKSPDRSQEIAVQLSDQLKEANRLLEEQRTLLSAMPVQWTSIDIKVHNITRDQNREMTGLEMRATRSTK